MESIMRKLPEELKHQIIIYEKTECQLTVLKW